MLNYKKPSFWIILISIVVVSIFAIGLLTNPENENNTTKNLSLEKSIENIIEKDMLGFNEKVQISKEIDLLDNKNNVVAKYLEFSNENNILKGYAIIDNKSGEILEPNKEGFSLLKSLIAKTNLPLDILTTNPVYYAGPFDIVVTGDDGVLYNLMDASGNVGEPISREDLDAKFSHNEKGKE